MKILKIIFVLSITFATSVTYAQSAKEWLEKTKQSAKQKAKDKLDNKIDEGLNKAVDAPEKIVKNKNKKNGGTENNSGNNMQNDNATTDPSAQAIGEIIIKTNIKCREGKETLEELIRGKNGVNNVSIDEKSGKVFLVLGEGFTTKEEIETLIRQSGYEANGKKKTGGNPECN